MGRAGGCKGGEWVWLYWRGGVESFDYEDKLPWYLLIVEGWGDFFFWSETKSKVSELDLFEGVVWATK